MDSRIERTGTPRGGRRPSVASANLASAHNYLLWLIPIAVLAIEGMISRLSALAGVYAYALAVLVLFGMLCFRDDDIPQARRNLIYALLALVIVRMFGAIFVLTPLVQPVQMAVITAASAVAIFMAVRAADVQPAPMREISSGAELFLQVAALGAAFLMAALYMLLSQRGFLPKPVALPDFSDTSGRIYASLVLGALFCFGILEELLFRRLLLLSFEPYVGIGASLLVAAIYSALFTGHLAPALIIFGFVLSLLFAAMVKLSGLTLGAAVAHGVLNVLIALLGPQFAPSHALNLAFGAFALTAMATLAALWLVMRRARQVQHDLAAAQERLLQAPDAKQLLLPKRRTP